MWNKLSCLMLIAAGIVSCTSKEGAKNPPQKVLAEYVSKSFAVKEPVEKQKLLELTTGEVKKTLQGLDEASFKHYFIDSKKEFVSLRIRDERNLETNRYSITYELAYREKNLALNTVSNPSNDLVTNKKHAILEKEGDQWRIAEVKNIKTTIEHENDISF